MINSIQAYQEAGTKAGRAQSVQDASTVRHWREHFQRMRDMEQGDNKAKARAAYEDAYRAIRSRG